MQTLDASDVSEVFERRKGVGSSIQHALHRFPIISPLLVLVVGWVVFALLADGGNFATWNSTGTILKQTAVLGTLAVGQTLIVLTAGVDLAVGTGMILTHIVVAKLFADEGWSGWAALLAGAVVAVVLGALHGFLVTRVGLPPFIVTLGTFYIFQSAGLVYSEAQTISKEKLGGADSTLLWPGKKLSIDTWKIFAFAIVCLALYAVVSSLMDLKRSKDSGLTGLAGMQLGRKAPVFAGIVLLLFGLFVWPGDSFRDGRIEVINGVAVMLALYLVFSYILSNTSWGSHLYATGNDPEASRLAGIKTGRVLLSVYMVAGLIYAIGGWVQLGRSLSASTNAATDVNLETITAVVIGGTSLFGGRGKLWGTLIGALIVNVCSLGLSLARIDVYYRLGLIGALIIFAVTLDQWIRGVAK